jgi:hypothetical protein
LYQVKIHTRPGKLNGFLAGGKKHKFPGPVGQRGDIVSRVIHRPVQIPVTAQRIQKIKTADNGFHIPDTFYPSGKFGFRGIGKRKYMKSISDPEKFTEERPGNITDKFPVMAAHTRRSINKHNKIDGIIGIPYAAGLLLAVGKQHDQQGEQGKIY